MKNKILILGWTLIHLTGCNGCGMLSSKETSFEPVRIRRFDKDLFQLILVDNPERQQALAQAYPQMFRVLGLSLFNHQDTTSDEFFDRLVNYVISDALSAICRNNFPRDKSRSFICTSPDCIRTCSSTTASSLSRSTNTWGQIICCIETSSIPTGGGA